MKLKIKKFVINNQTNLPKSIEFVMTPYEDICKIMEIHKETHFLYEIISYIINKTETSDDNNILFFTKFDKVNFFKINFSITDGKINPNGYHNEINFTEIHKYY